jgi:hypothetical protein
MGEDAIKDDDFRSILSGFYRTYEMMPCPNGPIASWAVLGWLPDTPYPVENTFREFLKSVAGSITTVRTISRFAHMPPSTEQNSGLLSSRVLSSAI